jgi:hypothetical protein
MTRILLLNFRIFGNSKSRPIAFVVWSESDYEITSHIKSLHAITHTAVMLQKYKNSSKLDFIHTNYGVLIPQYHN